MQTNEPTRDEKWMLRYAHDETKFGAGGVLYVRQDGECSYVLALNETFPESFVNALQDAMQKQSDHMFVVEHDGARLNVHAYPRGAAAMRMAAMVGAAAGTHSKSGVEQEDAM